MEQRICTKISLDYLSFTIEPTADKKRRLVKAFELGQIKPNGYGGMGYTESAHVLDGARIFWHPDKPELGIHVRLNSQSLPLTGLTAIGALNVVSGLGGKITRLDIAFDDTDGGLDIDHMYKMLLNGDVQTRFRKVARIIGDRIGENQRVGDTVNVGSRTSEAFIRIYDKRLQMISKDEKWDEFDHWVRVELELKGEKAHCFSGLLAETALAVTNGTAGELCAGLLLGLLDFKERGGQDTNKSRWETAEWWFSFLSGAKKKKLSIPIAQKTLSGIKRWVHNQVAPSLAVVLLSSADSEMESGYDFIMNAIVSGERRLSRVQKSLIPGYAA